MKKLTLVLVLAILVVVGAVAVGEHYKNYQTKKAHEARVVENKHTAEVATLKAEAEVNAKALQSQIEKLVAECQKGVRAYESLTVSQKAKVSIPVCTAR